MKVHILTGAALLALGVAPVYAGAPEGKAIYDKSCKNCHGAEGQGNPGLAKMLKVTFRHLGSKEVQAKSDDEIKSDVTKGTGKMKPVSNLNDKQLTDLVAFLRTLKQ